MSGYKKILLTALLAVVMSGCSQQEESVADQLQAEVVTEAKPKVKVNNIHFIEGDMEQALAAAKERDRLIMVDVYTDWCGPCKLMAAKVFTQRKVADFYNDKFINLKLNAEDEEENGPALAEQYDVHAYPTYLFLNSEGELVKRFAGFTSGSVFIGFGRMALGEDLNYQDAITEFDANPQKSVSDLESLIGVTMLYKNLKRKDMTKSQADEIVDALNHRVHDFFEQMDEAGLSSREAVEFVMNNAGYFQRGDKALEFMASHFDQLQYEGDRVELATAFHNINYLAVVNAARTGDEVGYKQYVSDIRNNWQPVYQYLNNSPYVGADRCTEVSNLADGQYAVSQGNYAEFISMTEQTLARWAGRANNFDLYQWCMIFWSKLDVMDHSYAVDFLQVLENYYREFSDENNPKYHQKAEILNGKADSNLAKAMAILVYIGNGYKKIGDREEALRILKEAEALFPKEKSGDKTLENFRMPIKRSLDALIAAAK